MDDRLDMLVRLVALDYMRELIRQPSRVSSEIFLSRDDTILRATSTVLHVLLHHLDASIIVTLLIHRLFDGLLRPLVLLDRLCYVVVYGSQVFGGLWRHAAQEQ